MPAAAYRRPVSDQPRKRAFYNESFKLQVVKSALRRPPTNRIKPTCACFPGIEPCQLRKWIGNLEAEARAQLDAEKASGVPASDELVPPAMDGVPAPEPKLAQLASIVAAPPPRVVIPPKKQPGLGGDFHLFGSPLADIEISLCAPTPPDSPTYGSSCSSSSCPSSCPSPASPKSDDFHLTLLPSGDATFEDATMVDQGVLAWQHHLALMHQGGVAVAQPSPTGLNLGMSQLAFAVAQPLLLPAGSPALPTTCVQECVGMVNGRPHGGAPPDEDRDISDAMLMDALLDDDTILDEVSSTGWVEDWLFDIVNGDR